MTKLEKLTAEIMHECEKDGEPVTAQEAEEMARMELGEKEVKRYEKSDKPRKKAVKARKVDADKAFLLNLIYNGIECDAVALGAKHNEADFALTYNGNEYTVKLIKHRPPKQAVFFLALVVDIIPKLCQPGC